MRVAFLGNHTVGVTVMRTLYEEGVLAGVGAHPPDPEDGVRYLSVHDHAAAMGLPCLRATGRSPELAAFLAGLRADLLVVADFRYLLPRAVLDLFPLGGVNFHPSLLPAYRGRAPVNWAILRGETRLGLTAHVLDETMDTGDIIAQRSFTLGLDQDVGDALQILYPLYADLAREVVAAFVSGHVPRRPQDHALASAFPRRRPEDGRIRFDAPARDIVNLVRAVARPYPGAFTQCDGRRLTIWKAAPIDPPGGESAAPGTVLHVEEDRFAVRCADAAVLVTDWAWDAPGPAPATGKVLGG